MRKQKTEFQLRVLEIKKGTIMLWVLKIVLVLRLFVFSFIPIFFKLISLRHLGFVCVS